MLQSCDVIDVIEMLTSLHEVVDYSCAKYGTNQVQKQFQFTTKLKSKTVGNCSGEIDR